MRWCISEKRWEIKSIDNGKDISDFIEINEEDREELLKQLSTGGKELFFNGVKLEIINQKTYPEEYKIQQELNFNSLEELNKTDWQVIREVERILLKNSELNFLREKLRNNIVIQEVPELVRY